MKPAVKVCVGEAHGAQGLPGCTVMSTHTNFKKIIHAGDDWHFTFDDPKTRLRIYDVSDRLSVEVINQTTVPLVITTKTKRGDELDDVLKANRKFHIAGGSKVVISA